MDDILIPEVTLSTGENELQFNEGELENSEITSPFEENSNLCNNDESSNSSFDKSATALEVEARPTESVNCETEIDNVKPIERVGAEPIESLDVEPIESNNDIDPIECLDDDPIEPTRATVATNGTTKQLATGNGIAKFMCSQVPDELSQEELEYYKKNFGPMNVPVQSVRVHCTACNVHLGSAPDNQENRCIHPLLKVIICKQCFDFYGSGDFDKDVDGSELYCRWCGQGGNVLCCSQCPYVFCQKCIRTNLGKKKVAQVKESDDWICFVCKPQDLTKHRVTCWALYDFVQQEIAIGDPVRLKSDKTTCCQPKLKPVSVKRSADELDYKEYTPSKKFKANDRPIAPAPKVWESQVEDEVVCTPDLSMLMEDDEESFENESSPSQSPVPEPIITKPPPLLPLKNVSNKSDVSFVGETRVTHKSNPVTSCSYKLHPVEGAAPKIPTNKSMSPNFISFQQPPIKFVNSTNSHSSQLAPGLKYDWFDTAAQRTARVNRNLSTRLCILSKQQISVTSLEDLANVHNSLQEILSTSIINLMQIRKNLKNNFILGLKKLKFCKPNENQSISNSPDDDVIFVEDPKPTTQNEEIKKPYLKVKPMSELYDKPSTIPVVTNIVTPTKPKPAPNVESNTSNYVNTNEVLSEVAKEIVNPETLNLIKKAVIESKFEAIVTNNMKYLTNGMASKDFKDMLSVRVVVGNNFDETLPSTALKHFKPFVWNKNRTKQTVPDGENDRLDEARVTEKEEVRVASANLNENSLDRLDTEINNEDRFNDVEEFMQMNCSEKGNFDLDGKTNDIDSEQFLSVLNGQSNF